MSESPAKQLAGFLGRYDPKVAAVARAALTKIRRRVPGALELVYDNYDALVIGFGPTERASDAILSIARPSASRARADLPGSGFPSTATASAPKLATMRLPSPKRVSCTIPVSSRHRKPTSAWFHRASWRGRNAASRRRITDRRSPSVARLRLKRAGVS